MTSTRPQPTPSNTTDKVGFALRQGALMAFALMVAGLVTEQLRPEETLDRGIVSTQFLWAIVLWIVVLAFDALAFDESQMRLLERTPLYGAAVIGAAVFVFGLVNYDSGSFGRRIAYLAANSVGAVMFWWAILGLCHLLARRLTPAQTGP